MKQLTILLLCGFIVKSSISQSNNSGLFFGKYKGLETVFYKLEGDTSTHIDDLNDTWGKKTLTLNSDGSFLLEFPDRWPRASMVQTKATQGNWTRIKDTLVLNSHYAYSDFIKVKEYKTDSNHIQVKLTYEGKKYYPDLSVSINNKAIDTRSNPWTYFPLDTVKNIEINRYNAPSDHKWVYRTANKNNNCFVVSLIDNVKGNNFVVEEYRLLIVGSSLIQIDEVFKLEGNCFKHLD
jgi:hypothetical protein